MSELVSEGHMDTEEDTSEESKEESDKESNLSSSRLRPFHNSTTLAKSAPLPLKRNEDNLKRPREKQTKPTENEVETSKRTKTENKGAKKNAVKPRKRTKASRLESSSDSDEQTNEEEKSTEKDTDESNSESEKTTKKKSTTKPAVKVRPKFFCSRGRDKNPNRTSTESMLEIQQKQLAKFRKHGKAKKWERIHADHFDWFMFPIEDGSVNKFNVLEKDVEELKKNEEWLQGYREGVMLVAKAWGWDVANSQCVEPRESGMGWTHWDVRLAKIIRSLWLFDQKDLMESMQKFTRVVKPRGGLYYGGICLDEVLYMTVDDN